MEILDLGPNKNIINNEILKQRSIRKLLKIENDKLFEQRKNKHRDSMYIKVGDW